MESRLINESDFDSIIEWGKQWGSSYQRELFPKTGLIVDGVAAYFLYVTDSSVAFVENLISNKYEDKEIVRKACEILINDICKLAKDKGVTVVYASTNNPSVILKALKVGANVTPNYALLQKVL